jgi:dihydrodipicolinate synthase/N-acetylneuraminate lyase
MHKKYDGPVFSVPMFFNEDHSIDYRSLENYLLKISNMSCVQAIYSMSYNTRYMQLSFDEVIQVNQFISKICSDRSVSFICGHPITCTEADLIKYAEKLDLSGQATMSVLYPERYFGINKVLYEYHQAPISLGYDILIHEMKLTSGFDGSLIDWQIDNLSTLLEHPKVTGIKEDSKNDDIATEMISRYGNDKNIIVAGGGKRRAMQLRSVGLRTWLNGSLMMFPEIGDRFMRAYNECDQQFLTRFEREV